MKRYHFILILAFLVIAAMLRWKNVRIQEQEAELRQELASVEFAALTQNSPSSTEFRRSPSTRASARPQVQVPDAMRVGAEMLENSKFFISPDESPETLESFDRMQTAIASGELAEAVRYFSLLPSQYHQEILVEKIVTSATTPDLQRSVLEQAGKSADQPTFSMLAQSIASKLTFEANRDLLSRAQLTPEKRDQAAAIIAGAKIDEDTPARAAWLLKSLQTNQTEPITRLAKSWTEGDFRAATTWVNTLPPGRNRDAAVVGFAPVAARLDGASAVDWALTISDPAQRTSTLESVTKTWKSREPAAAAAYLTEKGIQIKP